MPLQPYLLPSDHHRSKCPVDICSRQTVQLPPNQSTSVLHVEIAPDAGVGGA